MFSNRERKYRSCHPTQRIVHTNLCKGGLHPGLYGHLLIKESNHSMVKFNYAKNNSNNKTNSQTRKTKKQRTKQANKHGSKIKSKENTHKISNVNCLLELKAKMSVAKLTFLCCPKFHEDPINQSGDYKIKKYRFYSRSINQ